MLLNWRTRDLWEPEELRYAEIAREMVVSGDWVVPHLNGKIYPDKPPLYFWMIAVSSLALGGMNEFTVRLPSALAGIGCLVMTYLFGRRLFDERTARLAALLLLATPFFLWTANEARMDMPMLFFILLALYCLYLNYLRGGQSWGLHVAAYVCMGLGTLTKAPVAIILPLLTMAAYVVWRRDVRYLLKLGLPTGLLICALVILPWLVPACLRAGQDYTHNILFHQTLDRYVEGIRHKAPFYRYFLVFPADFLPWTLFLPTMLHLVRPGGFAAHRDRLMFPVAWWAVVFVFFSFSSGKRTIYILPLFPAAALWLACVLDALLSPSEGTRRRWMTVPLMVTGFLMVAAAVLAFVPIKAEAEDLAQTLSIAPIVSALSGAGVLLLVRRRNERAALSLLMTAILLVVWAFLIFDMPKINEVKSPRVLCDRLRALVQPPRHLMLYGSERASYSYYWGHVIPWSLDPKEVASFLRTHQPAFLLSKDKAGDLAKVLAEGVALHPVWSGRLGDRKLVLMSNEPGK